MSVISQLADDAQPLACFALILVLVVIVPFAGRRLRLPDCVSFILVGVIVGPHLLGVAPQHGAVLDFLGNLGKLLLMFFVGLKVDFRQFTEDRVKAGQFGLLTFALPMIGGTAAGVTFRYPIISSVLIGSLLASHTLIAFPIVAAAKLTHRPAVTITVGATVLTDMLSVLVLAGCLATFHNGFNPLDLLVQIAELIAFAGIVVFGLGGPARWIARHLGDNQEARFIVLLIVVCLVATLAEAINLEGIIGAFLAGLAVNRSVEGTEARHRLDFVGRAFFITAFFVVTGFIVDLGVLGHTLLAGLPLVLAIVGGLIVSKLLAAELAGRVWHLPADERGLMASLTLPQVAATLAAALVGYGTVNSAGVRLIDERMLNTVLVLVMVTSIVGPVLTERYVNRLSGIAPVPGDAEADIVIMESA